MSTGTDPGMGPDTNGAANLPVIDYTRLITCILYEGGAADVLEFLHTRGVNEAYYYSVRGAPIGRSSSMEGLPEIPKTEILHAVVTADQADYLYEEIYHFAKLEHPRQGIIFTNKLLRSSLYTLPANIQYIAREHKAA
jgi:hypothetical protein